MTKVLRYPYEALTETTDYLQITIKNYPGASQDGTLIENTNFGSNKSALDVSNTAASSLKPAQLEPENGVIILPMPSNIEDSNSVSYDGDTLNGLTAFGLEGFGHLVSADYAALFGMKNKENQKAALNDLFVKMGDSANRTGIANAADVLKFMNASLATSAVNIFGSNVSIDSLLARTEGKILNPNMELLFKNVTLRTFRFSFKMTPRDEVESMQVKSIIRSFKKNMAAKKASGIYLDTPNIFELEYKKGNKLHPFLHRFKQCALSDMSVNYTGENVYATYSDGTPISLILNLTFKELVPIYEDDYYDDAFTTKTENGVVSRTVDTSYKNGIPENRMKYSASTRNGDQLGVQADIEGVGY